MKICVQSPFFRELVRAVDLIKWLYWADDPIFNGEKGGEKARSQLAHCFFCFDKILNFAIDDGCQNSFHYQLQLQLKKSGKIKYYLDLFTVLETSHANGFTTKQCCSPNCQRGHPPSRTSILGKISY